MDKEDKTLASKYGFSYWNVGSVTSGDLGSDFASVARRFRRRCGQELFNRFGLENRYQLGYFIPELKAAALKLRAHFHIVHLEQAMWVGDQLCQMGRPVGVDMEDWYSEDLPAEARKCRPIRMLRAIEGRILRTAPHLTCPSRAMSEELVAAFGCRPPTVIYNAFEWSDRAVIKHGEKDRHEKRAISVHWVSQTLGPDRGLEDLFAALGHMTPNFDVHLRGKAVAGFDRWMVERLPPSWRSRIYVHATVPNEALVSRVGEHDIGFAGEMKYCRNKELTISNKILLYLLAGIAVVASDTAGHLEVAEQAPAAVRIYKSGDAPSLAANLRDLIDSPAKLLKAKAAALEAAAQTFCWEKQAPKLICSVQDAIRHRDLKSQAPKVG